MTAAVFEKARVVARAAARGCDDAAQEGTIRAWEILRDNPSAEPRLVNAAVRNRVRDIARGNPQTGSPRPKGAREASTRQSATPLDGWDLPPLAFNDPSAAMDVRLAVANLPDKRDRQIVYLHFWEDLTFDEVGPRVGLSRGGVSNRWWRVIAPALREALAHLDPQGATE